VRGILAGMSITIELPPDVDQLVKEIPDVEQRVVSFLRNQVEYEKWRKERYSAKALRLVEETKAEAEQLRASGKSREELFEEFMVLHERITKQIAEKG
jgi:glutamyl-tRNA reductase